jgi:hypothetical protein
LPRNERKRAGNFIQVDVTKSEIVQLRNQYLLDKTTAIFICGSKYSDQSPIWDFSLKHDAKIFPYASFLAISSFKISRMI